MTEKKSNGNTKGQEAPKDKGASRSNYDDRNFKSKTLPDGGGLLFNFVERKYKEMFEKQLDILEQVLIITAPERKKAMYGPLKSKVLRLGNDSLSSVWEEFTKFRVTPKEIHSDVIVPPLKDEKNTKEKDNG